MPYPGYTLLIVESPVIARIVQRLAPSYVYVLATGGYAWNPVYDARHHKIKALANPEKRSFRKELKSQAQWASQIVIATDTDPSGDFIAWSIAGFVSPRPVQRGFLKNLTRSGIAELLHETHELHSDDLETALQNRYLIQQLWYSQQHLPDYYAAGLAAIFGMELNAVHFSDEHKNLYKCSGHIHCRPDSLFTLEKSNTGTFWKTSLPVSTYDTIEFLFSSKITLSFEEAQHLLQKLFETELPSTKEPLISYPRTNATGFYSKTWEAIHSQFLQNNTPSIFKPPFLRSSIAPEVPHESIHPLHLKNTPEQVKKELHSHISFLYRWIYDNTLRAITLPEILDDVYISEWMPELYFHHVQATNHAPENNPVTVHPSLTISDLGKELARLQIIKPSRFGTELDRWLLKGWLETDETIVKPGKNLYPYLNKGVIYRNIFQNLNVPVQKKLSPETVLEILSS